MIISTIVITLVIWSFVCSIVNLITGDDETTAYFAIFPSGYFIMLISRIYDWCLRLIDDYYKGDD